MDESNQLVKQVIAIRKDLRMGIGKIVGQACHACLGASEETRKRDLGIWNKWHSEGEKKVIVKVFSLEELMDLETKAMRLRLPNILIVDKGLTQLSPNTPTCIGIGPADDVLIDRITGKLKLL